MAFMTRFRLLIVAMAILCFHSADAADRKTQIRKWTNQMTTSYKRRMQMMWMSNPYKGARAKGNMRFYKGKGKGKGKGVAPVPPSTAAPTTAPMGPTNSPTSMPTNVPTTLGPTFGPTVSPTSVPTTLSPTAIPTAVPTAAPTPLTFPPTGSPTNLPTGSPTNLPTSSPTAQPTDAPTDAPTGTTSQPTSSPTGLPTSSPTTQPTDAPTGSTSQPTSSPTDLPTISPSFQPTIAPTGTTFDPTSNPTSQPTDTPTSQPTNSPPGSTSSPTNTPTSQPTSSPTSQPTSSPTSQPTSQPTATPNTNSPTSVPTSQPTSSPTNNPAAPAVVGLQADCFEVDDARFNICLDIASPDGVTVEDWFPIVIQAKERWESIITAEAPWGVTGRARSRTFLESLPAEDIATDVSSLPEEGIDDLYVAVIVGDTGGAVALGESQFFLPSGEIFAGKITLNPADLATSVSDGTLASTVFHEFAHVLGFGNLWNLGNLADTTNLIYTGTNGLDAWQNTVGCTTGQLPIQNDLGHWSEACLPTEVMSPVFQSGQIETLSIVTLRSFQDLGYSIDLSQADAYTICDVAASCTTECPERASAVCLRRLGSTNSRSIKARAKLSGKGEAAILDMAVAHFRNEETRRLEQGKSQGDDSLRFSNNARATDSSFSVIYKENDSYFSRSFLRHQVEHLLW